MKENIHTLYHKYRPKALSEMIGNSGTISALEKVLNRKQNIPHAFLFSGPSGCGKTTLARIIKDQLGCAPAAYHEIDTADFRGIDMVREIRRKCKLRPVTGPVSVWLLDECHMLGRGGDSSKNEAQNALLKVLENSPNHAYFILATTNPEQLIPTIKNRCMQFQVEEVQSKTLEKWLFEITRKERKRIPNEVLKQITMDSLGSPRAALMILDKIIDLPSEEMLEAAKQQAESENEVIELCRILMNGGWKQVSSILKGITQEPEKVRWAVLSYFTTVLVNSGQEKAYVVIDSFKDPFYNCGKAGLVAACWECTH